VKTGNGKEQNVWPLISGINDPSPPLRLSILSLSRFLAGKDFNLFNNNAIPPKGKNLN